jgi:thioredoxin-related protein
MTGKKRKCLTMVAQNNYWYYQKWPGTSKAIGFLNFRVTVILAFLFCGWICFSAEANEEFTNFGNILEEDDVGTDPAFSHQREDHVFRLSSIESIVSLNHQTRNDPHGTSLVLLLIYTDSCHFSESILRTLSLASSLLDDFFATYSLHYSGSPPTVAKLQLDNIDPRTLYDNFGIEGGPKLLFIVSHAEDDKTYLLEFSGAHGSGLSIFERTLHLWYHAIVPLGDYGVVADQYVYLKPRRFESTDEIFSFLKEHRDGLLLHSVVNPMLPSTLTNQERIYVEWLMLEENDTESDDFVLLVQCQKYETDATVLYNIFNKVASSLAARRDRLFLTSKSCSMVDGAVQAWKIPRQHAHGSLWDKENFPRIDFVPKDDEPGEDLADFLTDVSTPSVLWFDRQTTAPIAFGVHRKVHACLFLNLHQVPPDVSSHAAPEPRTVLRQFRRACRIHRRTNRSRQRDLVCVIIPSLETRVLSTFGIDLWSLVDAQVLNSEGPNETEILPQLLITDQRHGGTQRFYLDRASLLASSTAISDFINSFWDGAGEPTVRSASESVETNASRIRILSGDNAGWEMIQNSLSKHSLIYFTSPTCGHCKRFSTIWNQLGTLLGYIGWESFLTLYQFDVTANDLPLSWNLTVKWVPDVYYLAPSGAKNSGNIQTNDWVCYEWNDVLDDGVGRISKALEIVDWVIHVGNFSDEELSSLLSDLDTHF